MYVYKYRIYFKLQILSQLIEVYGNILTKTYNLKEVSLIKIEQYKVYTLLNARMEKIYGRCSNLELSLGDGNSLFAIFDGHGGDQVSQYVKTIFKQTLLKDQFYQKGQYQKAMIQTFKSIDNILRSSDGQRQLRAIRDSNRDKKCLPKEQKNQKIGDNVGCTANVVLVTPLVYVVANCGDSRSILSRRKVYTPMSFDHKPQNPSQSERIQKAGGQVFSGRINGNLNLSRGFGDFRYKDQSLKFDQTIVTCMPEVKIFPRSLQDQFILIGCDGVFERYFYDETPLVKMIKRQRKAKKGAQKIFTKLFDSIIAKDVTQILGCDNMSGILIQLN